MRVYVASKAKHAPWWRALRASGLDVCSTWVDWPYNQNGAAEPSPGEWGTHWQRCVDQAAACDVLLLYALDGETQKGALIELGAALAAGKQVFIVAPFDWSWKYHPNVAVFDTLDDALKALVTPADKKGGP